MTALLIQAGLFMTAAAPSLVQTTLGPMLKGLIEKPVVHGFDAACRFIAL